MRSLCFALLLCLASAPAYGQTKISDMSAASALGGTELVPIVQGGVNVRSSPSALLTYIQNHIGFTGDCAVSSDAITCTKTSGSSFVASATTDTTNASNITTGTLGAARLPNPSSSTLGGVQSIAAASNNFLTAISTSGVPAAARPTCANLSDSAAFCTGTDAANLTGTISVNRFNSGTSASSSTFLRGDGTWVAPSGGSGTVTETGTHTSGSLAAFSTAPDIITGNLSGDCTTTNTLAVTCLKTNAVSFTAAATTSIGTSGATIPLLSTANTWTLGQTFTAASTISAASATSVLCVDGSKVMTSTCTSTTPSFGATTLGGALTYGGVALSNAVTGTGNMVLSTSPTLVTPALGTPASGVGTNLTGLTLAGHASQAANTVVANVTAGSAAPTAFAMPSCSGAENHLQYTTSTGFTCLTLAAPVSTAPSNPSSTVSLTVVMMGIGSTVVMTPLGTGKVEITVTGQLQQTTATATNSLGLYYGTGTAPVNGAAVTGTRIGSNFSSIKPAAVGAATAEAFTLTAIVTGLTLSTAIWVDIGLATGNASDALQVTSLSASVKELP